MRLLNKRTHELEWFADDSLAFPNYLILSHRWIGQETTLQLFEIEKGQKPAHWSPGIAKIMRLCIEALAYQAEYVWIDTCCTDKTNSVELSEAINLMFKWYEQADKCLVYLDDVDAGVEMSETKGSIVHDASAQLHAVVSQFSDSLWFTRGWTLQELLAPSDVVFVDRSWRTIGNLRDQIICSTVADITTIDQSYLLHETMVSIAPIATRLSWMAERQISRSEDQAYCLLGFLNVNMTMRYGEGQKAFHRLQRKLIHHQDDESVFLWMSPPEPKLVDVLMPQQEYVPALAPSPGAYACCRGLNIQLDTLDDREPIRVGGKGLEMMVRPIFTNHFEPEQLHVVLNCTIDGKRAFFRVGQRPMGVAASRDMVWYRLADDALNIYTSVAMSYQGQGPQMRIYICANAHRSYRHKL